MLHFCDAVRGLETCMRQELVSPLGRDPKAKAQSRNEMKLFLGPTEPI